MNIDERQLSETVAKWIESKKFLPNEDEIRAYVKDIARLWDTTTLCDLDSVADSLVDTYLT